MGGSDNFCVDLVENGLFILVFLSQDYGYHLLDIYFGGGHCSTSCPIFLGSDKKCSTYLIPYSAHGNSNIFLPYSARAHIVDSERPELVPLVPAVLKSFFSPSSDSIDMRYLGSGHPSSWPNRNITTRAHHQPNTQNHVTRAR